MQTIPKALWYRFCWCLGVETRVEQWLWLSCSRQHRSHEQKNGFEGIGFDPATLWSRDTHSIHPALHKFYSIYIYHDGLEIAPDETSVVLLLWTTGLKGLDSNQQLCGQEAITPLLLCTSSTQLIFIVTEMSPSSFPLSCRPLLECKVTTTTTSTKM